MHGGTFNGAQVLRRRTVAIMSRNAMGDLVCNPMKTALPGASNDVDFMDWHEVGVEFPDQSRAVADRAIRRKPGLGRFGEFLLLDRSGTAGWPAFMPLRYCRSSIRKRYRHFRHLKPRSTTHCEAGIKDDLPDRPVRERHLPEGISLLNSVTLGALGDDRQEIDNPALRAGRPCQMKMKRPPGRDCWSRSKSALWSVSTGNPLFAARGRSLRR